jgi:hypothetical protein
MSGKSKKSIKANNDQIKGSYGACSARLKKAEDKRARNNQKLNLF